MSLRDTNISRYLMSMYEEGTLKKFTAILFYSSLSLKYRLLLRAHSTYNNLYLADNIAVRNIE